MTFAAHLASERLARGLSKRALAIRAGVSPAYVTLLEQGRRAPARAVATALGRALASLPRLDGEIASPDPTQPLLAAAGYAVPDSTQDDLGERGAGSAPAGAELEPAAGPGQFRAPAALAAALADPDLPPGLRQHLDALVFETVRALHLSARRGRQLPSGARRSTILSLLARHEEESVRRAIEDYSSPMYDL